MYQVEVGEVTCIGPEHEVELAENCASRHQECGRKRIGKSLVGGRSTNRSSHVYVRGRPILSEQVDKHVPILMCEVELAPIHLVFRTDGDARTPVPALDTNAGPVVLIDGN